MLSFSLPMLDLLSGPAKDAKRIDIGQTLAIAAVLSTPMMAGAAEGMNEVLQIPRLF